MWKNKIKFHEGDLDLRRKTPIIQSVLIAIHSQDVRLIKR